MKRRIDEADQGRGPEQAVIDAAQALPPGYGSGFVDRIRQARERMASSAALDQALAAAPQSDLAIAAAAERARADGTWPTDRRSPLAASWRSAAATGSAPSTRSPPPCRIDEQDAQWAAGWDHALLADCHDAREHRVRYARAVDADRGLRRAGTGVPAKGDAVAVKRLSRDPKLADHPGLARHRAEIDALIAKSERVERLVAAAAGGQADAFLGEAEPGLLAAHAGRVRPLPRSDRRVGRPAAPAERHPASRPIPMFLPDPSGTAVTARWAWAQPRLVRICLVATDTVRFLDRPEEARQGTFNLDPETHRRARGGTTCSVPMGCRKLFVTVWPVVDLGWDRRIGPPSAHRALYRRLGRTGPRGRPAGCPETSSVVPSAFRGWFENLLNW